MSRAVSLATELGPKIARAGWFSLAARRGMHSKGGFFLSPEFKEEVSKQIDPVAEEFAQHRALNHDLFAALKEWSKTGFTPKQYETYRDNFFRRTQLTIPSIAATLASAATYEDYKATKLALRNLIDEVGQEDDRAVHSQLMIKSHNIHGMRVFRLDPMATMADVACSELLLREVEEYRKAKEDIFKRPYPYVAGNTWAHELAADQMLDHFRQAFFDPYLGFYSEKEAEEVMRFFTVHKDESHEGGDIEKQHEKMAREAAESACLASLAHVPQVREGGLIFLEHQAQLWDGLLLALERAKTVGEVVPPRPREAKPNPRVQKVILQKVGDQEKDDSSRC